MVHCFKQILFFSMVICSRDVQGRRYLSATNLYLFLDIFADREETNSATYGTTPFIYDVIKKFFKQYYESCSQWRTIFSYRVQSQTITHITSDNAMDSSAYAFLQFWFRPSQSRQNVLHDSRKGGHRSHVRWKSALFEENYAAIREEVPTSCLSVKWHNFDRCQAFSTNR